MGLQSAEQQPGDAPAAQCPKRAFALVATKTQFRVPVFDEIGQFGHGRAEPLRILLGGNNGQAQDASPIHQPAAVPDHAGTLGHRGGQLFLHVDHHQGRIARAHQLGTATDRFWRSAAHGTENNPSTRGLVGGRDASVRFCRRPGVVVLASRSFGAGVPPAQRVQ